MWQKGCDYEAGYIQTVWNWSCADISIMNSSHVMLAEVQYVAAHHANITLYSCSSWVGLVGLQATLIFPTPHCIAENFWGRKLSRIDENTIFAEKTFAICSLLQRMPCYQIPRRNFREWSRKCNIHESFLPRKFPAIWILEPGPFHLIQSKSFMSHTKFPKFHFYHLSGTFLVLRIV